MTYAIEVLIHRWAVLVHIDSKSGKMLLLLSEEDGTYWIWSAGYFDHERTRLKHDNRVVPIIDPPEDRHYFSHGECRIFKFVSYNAKIHFRNWTKYGVLLVTSIRSEREVVAMTKVLWNEENAPHPGQRSEFNTLQES